MKNKWYYGEEKEENEEVVIYRTYVHEEIWSELKEVVEASIQIREEYPTDPEVKIWEEVLDTEAGRILMNAVRDADFSNFGLSVEEELKRLEKERPTWEQDWVGEFLADLCGDAVHGQVLEKFGHRLPAQKKRLKMLNNIEDALLVRAGSNFVEQDGKLGNLDQGKKWEAKYHFFG